MPRLAKAHAVARRAILDAAASGFGPDALGRRIMAALAAAIPVDGYRLFGVDSTSLLVNRLLAASDSDAWARAEWLREVYLQAGELGYIELPALMQSGLTAVAFHERQETCWGYTPEVLAEIDPDNHRRLFHELRSPVGGTLLACFPVEGKWVAVMQAYRRDADAPFRQSDVAFVRMMAPTIGRAIAAALSREQAQRAPSDDEAASGVLIFGPTGTLQFSTPAGEQWCRRIDEPEADGLGPIPTAVWASVAKLRATAAPSAQIVAPSSAGPVRIEASPAGTDGSVAVVLTPVRPAFALESPPGWPLTGAERRVVDRALRGMTNAAIAEQLFLSPNTIEWHLRSAYEKLGVGSRTGLLARLFEEFAPPGLLAADPVDARGAAPTPRR